MYGRSRVNVKVKPHSTFTFTRGLSYIVSISVTRVHTEKLRDSGNQPEIFSLHVVFPFNITCKTNSRLEVDAYCFEFLARAMIKNFEPSAAYNLKLQRKTTN